jgi:ABC-type transport system involved in multi-copper enzyme maturation permease subunit
MSKFESLVRSLIFILILITTSVLLFYIFPVLTIKYLLDLAVYHSIQPLFNLNILSGLIAHSLIFSMDREAVVELKIYYLYTLMVVCVGKYSLDIICGEGYDNFKKFISDKAESARENISKKIKGEEFIEEVKGEVEEVKKDDEE